MIYGMKEDDSTCTDRCGTGIHLTFDNSHRCTRVVLAFKSPFKSTLKSVEGRRLNFKGFNFYFVELYTKDKSFKTGYGKYAITERDFKEGGPK